MNGKTHAMSDKAEVEGLARDLFCAAWNHRVPALSRGVDGTIYQPEELMREMAEMCFFVAGVFVAVAAARRGEE